MTYVLGTENKDLPDMLANIVTASENLLKIVNQLLNFTRKWESPVVEVRLDEFVTNAFMLLEAQANNAGVTLVNEAEPVTARLKADALEQVLINILMNAVTASPRGAGVTVKAALKGDGVEVAVSDRGIGMTEEQASRVFDPLYSSWPMKTGMGLGLSLARQIVESLGGTIEVSSKLAQGTTFTVWIPQGVAE
ncbi:MAG TPA: HAMP domain-containing sensor histidine kinase, partial [Deltaproteobacteria bacterium]|nr:HAMP domain-containing sensor histidine kinase [Deltaproteobacteria bacterium]